jgi:hypothetical protein
MRHAPHSTTPNQPNIQRRARPNMLSAFIRVNKLNVFARASPPKCALLESKTYRRFTHDVPEPKVQFRVDGACENKQGNVCNVARSINKHEQPHPTLGTRE